MYQGTVNDLGGILRGPVPRRCENREDSGEPPKVIHRAVTGARGSRTGSRCSGDPQVLN